MTAFWKLSTVIPVQTQRLWQGAGMEQASYNSASVASRPIGQFVFDTETEVWKRKAPAAHAAKKVRVELDRQSYVNRTRTREMRHSIMPWSFPDIGG